MLLLEEQHEPGDRRNSKWHIDEKHPTPIVDVSEITAECWSKDWTNYDARRPNGHGRSTTFNRIQVQHHRLRQGHKRSAETALKKPEDNFLREILCHAAQHRGDGEADQRGDEKRFAP